MNRFRLHYKLLGKLPVPCDLVEWALWFETAERHVAKTEVGGLFLVSTVFLGLDHNWGRGDPLLFETMVFDLQPHDMRGLDGEMTEAREDYLQTRCATWGEAEEMHAAAVAWAEAQVAAAASAIETETEK